MNALAKGLIVAAAQVALAASVGAKFLFDRANYPRVWVETAPYDPDLPIRGRYVSVATLVDAKRDAAPQADTRDAEMYLARLEVQDDRLVAVEDETGKHWVMQRTCGNAKCWQLTDPLAFFIPEHVADPSRRPAGETLWVEVTVPPTGAPRPLRLGVKKDGTLTPLDP
ncbi:MAG: hypothetical protein AB7T20_02140 [Steroidobacteraceae bacterium]